MKKTLRLLWDNLRALTSSTLENIGLIVNDSETSTKSKSNSFWKILIALPLVTLVYLLVITVGTIVTIVYFAVSLLRMPSLRKALWRTTLQSITKVYEFVMTKIFRKGSM
jgi:hypothetical protein